MSDLDLSDVLRDNWLLQQDDQIIVEEMRKRENPTMTEKIHQKPVEETVESEEELELLEVFGSSYDATLDDPKETRDVPNPAQESEAPKEPVPAPTEKRVFISPPYHVEQMAPFVGGMRAPSRRKPIIYQQPAFYSNQTGHGLPISSTYHQPFVPMVRNNKKHSALSSALQRPAQLYAPPMFAYIPGYQMRYGIPHPGVANLREMNNNDVSNSGSHRERMEMMKHNTGLHDGSIGSTKKETSSFSTTNNAFSSTGCSTNNPQTTSSFIRNQQIRCFELPSNVLDADDTDDDLIVDSPVPNGNADGRQSRADKTVPNGGDADEGLEGQKKVEKPMQEGDAEEAQADERDDEDEEIIVVDERDEDAVTTVAASAGGEVENTTSPAAKEHPKSELAALLSQPVKRPIYQEFQPFIVTFSPSGTQQVVQQSPKTMQFYQPPAQQHLARATPPPGFAQVNPYGMNMRPHEEETRQIMNLDNQQTHNSSPTSSWNQQPYGQMTNLNAYQPRGQALYASPVPTPMVHQNGPPGVVPTSNPYYQAPPHAPQHHHMQPQAPMMPPGMHAQQQQPYYNTQSPLTGTPPSMNYGTPQMPAPQPANGSAPIFNFSKPRNSNESSSSSGGGGGGHRRKKHNDLGSPRYNSNSEDVDASVFPDMSHFPLLDVIQSKAKKDAGRKPCRPHLCEQSRMLISRVCHFHRDFVKRLPPRHPLANSPFSKPDQWTSTIMGISLATVRKCVDMAVEGEEEVFTRCTDKNLVNLTPAERAEREELLSKLSTVFEDEKALGAGTAGLTIAEYSPSSFRRSYSNTLLRQSTDDKSSTSSYAMNGADFGSSETTLLNLDDHSNSSKDFGTTPTPSSDMINGGHIFEEIGAIGGGNEVEKEIVAKIETTPKRGRPRKAPGTTTTKSSRRKESMNEDSEVAEDKDEHEKKTEDEDETNEETEKKTEEPQQVVLAEREDDAASSEGTNRSEAATPEPTAMVSASKKARATRRKKRSTVEADEDYTAATKKKRGSIVSGTSGLAMSAQMDDENEEHKMVTRARSRQP